MTKAILLTAAALMAASTAHATTIIDPKGDFLPSYTGPHNADLDVLSAGAISQGSRFLLTGKLAGKVGTTVGADYAWGINRGAGVPGLAFGTPSIGSGVLFDALAVLFANGTGFVLDFNASGPPTQIALAPGSVTVSGDAISAFIPLADLPSTGFTALQYGFNLWPDSGRGGNEVISDLAPDNSTFTASVPEASSLTLAAAGFGVVALASKRRRARG